MILRSILAVAAPFVLLNLRAPDAGAPAGGGGSAQPPAQQPGPFDSENAPELTGETLEAKVTGAGSIIKTLFQAGKDLVSRLGTTKNERDRLEQQFNAATSDLQTEKDAHTKTTGELSAAKTTITGLTSERDTANKHVERLEKLCNLRGIDHKTIVPGESSPAGGAGGEQLSEADFTARMNNAKTPAERKAIAAEFEKAVKDGKIKKATK